MPATPNKTPAPAVKVAAANAAPATTLAVKAASRAPKGPVTMPQPPRVSRPPKGAVTTAPPAKAVKPVKAAKPEKAMKPAKVEKPVKAPKPVKASKPAKPVKARPVRDSFTMPEADFALIAQLKRRLITQHRETKKSELLRAGLHALAALDDAALRQALDALAPVKVGRPPAA